MPKKNYYDILGISTSATEEQIKQRYKQLVLKYHPDVADDKAVAQARFLEISEAYHTLINPDRKLIYDASLNRRVSRPKPDHGQASGATVHTGVQRGSSATQTHASHAQSRVQDAQRIRDAQVAGWLKEARTSFANTQFRSAIYACKEVIRLDQKNLSAYVMLGDIYHIQGRLDEAAGMYSAALQIDPKNVDVRAKFDRVARRDRVIVDPDNPDDFRFKSLRIGLNLIGVFIIGFLLLIMTFDPGDPMPWIHEHLQFIGEWTPRLIISLCCSGVVAGFLLAINGKVHSLDDELFFKTIHAYGQGVAYPTGLILVVLNFFNFYIAVAVYTIASVVSETLSKSVMYAFATAAAVTLLIALFFSPAREQVLLFGGNFAFIGILGGWMLADLFRPTW